MRVLRGMPTHKRSLFGEMWEFLSGSSLLEFGLSFDLKEFKLNQFMVLRQASKFGERPTGFFLTAVMNQPTRCERHEYHASGEDHCRKKLESKWYNPCGITLALASASDIVLTEMNERPYDKS